MKRVLKTVVVAFAIALALILIKNEYARCLPASTYGMQAAIRKERVDNLFIGSSMFRQGLDTCWRRSFPAAATSCLIMATSLR